MSYTLQECLERTGSLRRGKYVYRVLCQNNIRTWDDFLEKPIPGKGLYGNEVLTLDRLRTKVKKIRMDKAEALKNMTDVVAKFTTRSSANQITGALARSDIWSSQLLVATSDEKLFQIYGIGPKRLDILRKVKKFLTAPKAETSVKVSRKKAAESPMQPLLAF